MTTPTEAKPAETPVKNEEKKAGAKTGAIVPAKTSPKMAPVDFDPRTLNPKENARLKIDAKQMPANLAILR